MKFFGIWTLLVAISISVVAAYYSIVGLATIFAAAMIPVIIMGSVLEVSKITTAIWLHLNWKTAPFLIKAYLTSATIVLMLITSMGIFGFLSKAHIEQNATSKENYALISQIDRKIQENETVISAGTSRINDLEKTQDNTIEKIQSDIVTEQENIDRIVSRIQPSIDEQNNIILQIEKNITTKSTELETDIKKLSDENTTLKTELSQLNSGKFTTPDNTILVSKRSELSQLKLKLAEIDTLIKNPTRENIIIAQTIVNITPKDGINGRNTSIAVQAYRSDLTSKIAILDEEITAIETDARIAADNKKEFSANRISELASIISNNDAELTKLKASRDELLSGVDPRIQSARDKITTIRESVTVELEKSNTHIQQLRNSLDAARKVSVADSIIEQQSAINVAKDNISRLTTEKFSIESELRKLEAEVGPLKYIAQLIYSGETNETTLETAVRFVILLLVFVFDPLAIVLVLAGLRQLEFSGIKKSTSPAPITPVTPEIPKKRKYTKKTKLPETPTTSSENETLLVSEVVAQNTSTTTIKTKNKAKGWLDI